MLECISETSKVWIYQAERPLSDEEQNIVESQLTEFVNQWNTHGTSLLAHVEVKHQLFIILAVDESHQYASGCSIDSSVHRLKEISKQINVDFFNRLIFSYKDDNDQILTIKSSEMKEAYYTGKIHDKTLFFDTLVKDMKSLNLSWMKPLKNSWHYRFV